MGLIPVSVFKRVMNVLYLNFAAAAAVWQEMKEFHTEEYIDFLLRITPDNMHEMADRMKQHNVGFVGQYDCPVFDGIFPFCQVLSCSLCVESPGGGARSEESMCMRRKGQQAEAMCCVLCAVVRCNGIDWAR